MTTEKEIKYQIDHGIIVATGEERVDFYYEMQFWKIPNIGE